MIKVLLHCNIWYLIFSIIALPVFAAEAGNSMDLASPNIEHEPVTKTMKANEALPLEVTVTDNTGVRSVTLFYRTQGMTDYRTLTMSPVKDSQDKFAATIPGTEVVSDKLEYFVQAVDVNGNTVTRGGKLFPLSIALSGNVPVAETAAVRKAFEEKGSNNTWYWVVGGLVLGALALSGGSDDGGSDNSQPQTKTGSLTVVGPAP